MDKTISMYLSKLNRSKKRKLEFLGVFLWVTYSFLFMKIGIFLVFLVYFVILTTNKPTTIEHSLSIYSFLGILFIYDLTLLVQVNITVVLLFLATILMTSLWFYKKRELIPQLSVGFVLLLVPILLLIN